MKPLQTTKSNLLMCCIIIGTLSISAGCKTTSLSKPQPKNFKFWETEDKLSASENTKMPPPPARHFSPSPLDSAQEDIVMDLKSPSAEDRQPIGSLNDLRREITNVSEDSRNPIRKPYELSGLSTNQPASFGGRDLPKVKPNGFAPQLKSNNNDFISNQNTAKNSSQLNPGFKAPNSATPEGTPNMLSYGGSLNKNPAFSFNNGKGEKSLPETKFDSPEQSQLKSELLTAQEQLRALQSKGFAANPMKPNPPKLPSTAPINNSIQSPSQPFVKPAKPPYSSTDFESFVQKPLPQTSLNQSNGFNKTFPLQALKVAEAQQIPPAITSLDNKSAVQKTSIEVDLPPSILHGKSSYAPGSTKKLIPK